MEVANYLSGHYLDKAMYFMCPKDPIRSEDYYRFYICKQRSLVPKECENVVQDLLKTIHAPEFTEMYGTIENPLHRSEDLSESEAEELINQHVLLDVELTYRHKIYLLNSMDVFYDGARIQEWALDGLRGIEKMKEIYSFVNTTGVGKCGNIIKNYPEYPFGRQEYNGVVWPTVKYSTPSGRKTILKDYSFKSATIMYDYLRTLPLPNKITSQFAYSLETPIYTKKGNIVDNSKAISMIRGSLYFAGVLAIYVPLVFISQSKSEHSQLLIIIPSQQKMYLYDPHGPEGKHLNPKVAKKAITASIQELEEYQFVYPGEMCPYIGAQYYEEMKEPLEIREGDRGGFCEMWGLWVIVTCITNPGIDPSVIFRDSIDALGGKDLRRFIRRFTRTIQEFIEETTVYSLPESV